jgi:hypothetical protein
LIVENKRQVVGKDFDKQMEDSSEQLNSYISVLFLDRKYSNACGIATVGKYWKWYVFSRTSSKKGHKSKNSWGNESYSEDDVENFVVTHESPTYDISSDGYEKQIKSFVDSTK